MAFWWLLSVIVGLGAAWFGGPLILKALIRHRLQGYRIAYNRVDETKPLRLEGERRAVAVIGGGVAGLTAAVTLARRGFAVTLFESAGHLGGKLGSWKVQLTPTETQWVSHGYHAFFRHYYNLNRFLNALGLRQKF